MINIFLSTNPISPNVLIAFLLGIATGAVILVAVISILAIKGKKETKKIYGPKVENISQEKIRELIKSKQNAFTFEVEENEADYLKTALEMGKELLHEVSSYYYPDSKYPEYELTITEATELIHYITDQISGLFDRPVLRSVKNMRISTITSIIDKSRKATKSVKAFNDSEVNEAYNSYRAVKNIISPVYWFRKIVMKGTVNLAIKKVCKAGLSIVGEETNKVYSKSLFKKEPDIDVEKDIEEIFNDEEDK
ncbi:MAG: hypothetical protein H6687_01700 [Bacillales bacterium]|nr:hypothetical protein [Bacillales bacterium]